MLGMLVTADNLVVVLFGEKWLPSVPLLQVLCLAGVFWPLHVINLNVLKAQGYSHLFFRLEVIKKVVGTVFLLVGIIYFGVIGLAWSQVAFSVVAFFINAFYTGRYLNYGALKQMKDFISVLIISGFMAGIVLFTGEYIENSAFFMLVQQVLIGVCSYILFCVVFQISAYKDLMGLLVIKKVKVSK